MNKTIREDTESGDPKQGEADLTIREEGAEVQGTDETLVEGAASEEASPSTLNLVPGALFEGYRLKEPLKVTSAEADLWQVEDAQSGKPFVLKLYRYGIKPKEDIGHAIRKLRREHIVEVLKSGEAEGRVYEIQESIEHGSLAEWGKKGRLSDKEGQEVLRELSEALAHLHEANVVHRDIKPSNILIRTEEPLDLVLIDFGIASMADLSLHLTNLNRTAAYCAPETIQGVVGKESDWWSVGVVMLEMLEGRHPWGGMSEQAINFQLVSRGMKVPEGVGREWGQLLKGLLTRDGERRWGAGEVSQWLGGSRDVRVYYEGEVEQERKRNYRPYKFGGKEYWEAKGLGVVLGENWEEGVKHFGRGLITDWVKGDLKDQELTSHVLDIKEEEELDGDQKLSVALLLMNQELPLMWMGEVVTREWLAGNPDKTIELCKSKLPKLYDLHRSGSELNLLEIAGRVNEMSGDKALQGPEREAVVGLLLDENQCLKWGEQEVNAQWLAAKPKEALNLSQSAVLGWYERLRGRDELVIGLQRVREAEELKAKKKAEELKAKKEEEELKAKKRAEELKAKKEEEELKAKVTITKNQTATIQTTKGEMSIELWPDVAPGTVENFKNLANDGFYDGTCFHRIMAGFMIQGGDPQTKDESLENLWGTGDPGYKIKAEFNDRLHVRGVISMARSADPDSAGSQFFVCLGDADFLNGQYTAFGQLSGGDDALGDIGDTPVGPSGSGENSKPMERVEVTSIRVA